MARIRSGYWLIAIGCCITVTAAAEVTVSTVALPGGSSGVGAFSMASCYGQPTMTPVSIGLEGGHELGIFSY